MNGYSKYIFKLSMNLCHWTVITEFYSHANMGRSRWTTWCKSKLQKWSKYITQLRLSFNSNHRVMYRIRYVFFSHQFQRSPNQIRSYYFIASYLLLVWSQVFWAPLRLSEWHKTLLRGSSDCQLDERMLLWWLSAKYYVTLLVIFNVMISFYLFSIFGVAIVIASVCILWKIKTWAPSQYKHRLIYVWRYPC